MAEPDLKAYGSKFYATQSPASYRSALRILGLLWSVYHPRDLIDLGCGGGTWLKAAGELGIGRADGVEGPWLTRELAVVPFERIRHHDLRTPLRLEERYDLAMSLEVAEHLPEGCARDFVESLTRLAPVVLFSAAGVGQGGTQHVNEQQPAYWAALFRERGYVPIDAIRRLIWEDSEVQWWYAQNVLLYVEAAFLVTHPALQAWKAASATPAEELPLALVHPERLLAPPSLKGLLRQLPGAVRAALRRRLGHAAD